MDTRQVSEARALALPRLDVRAYGIAALTASASSLIAGLLLSGIALGDAAFILRVSASLLMGPSVIPVMAGNPPLVLLAGLLVHFALGFVYAGLIVLVIHRWGMAIGLVGGALLGLALYTIGIYALSYFFPWIYPLRNWILLLIHLILGGLVGVVYELLDAYDLPFPAASET
ncbi:MAG TPA: hypothetical protein VFI11_01670 [Anaerolineales bacterium]|nr:hypothetical protein [Anaerolineales bacterium]